MRSYLATLAFTAAAVLAPAAPQSAPHAAAPPTTFDAFTIKPAPPPPGPVSIAYRTDPTRLTFENYPLRTIILNAYQLKPYQFVGPDWMSSTRFSITAVTAAPVSKEQMNLLLQGLLGQQFQLKFHRAGKTMDVYNLVVADGGSKLKHPGPDGMMSPYPLAGQVPKPLTKNYTLTYINTNADGGAEIRLFGDLTINRLVTGLSRYVDRPIFDQTGLAGDYAINLTFAASAMAMLKIMSPAAAASLAAMRAAPQATPAGAAAEPARSLSSALQQQLGLKLAASKGSVEQLVIDSASRHPIGQ
ncbi:MAG: TIGR03435 family protein [Terriglobales bacterium]